MHDYFATGMKDYMAEPHLSHIIPMSQQAIRQIQQEAREELAQAVESESDLEQFFEDKYLYSLFM